MHIVIIGTAYPYRGGLASFNERMALELQKEGHTVDIYTFTVQYPSFLFPGKTQYSEEEAPDSLKITRKVNSINPFNWWKIGREIKRLSPDLVLVKYWIPFIGACLGTILRGIKKNKKTKIISVLDNIIPHEKRLLDRTLTSYFVQPIDGFVAMSHSVMNDLSKFDSKKPRAYNPHPLFDNFGKVVSRDKAAQFLNLPKDSQYILFFGIVRDYKGLDWLLEAYSKIKFKIKVKLIVAGEYYENRAKYEKLLDRYKLRDRVLIYDHFIKDSEVKYFFSLANVVVQPYKNATQSGVTQIGYQFNCPMIVTNVGGLPEMIPDNIIGYVTDPNPRAIQLAVERFFNEEKESLFRKNIKEEKKKYEWSNLNKTIFKLLKEIKDDS